MKRQWLMVVLIAFLLVGCSPNQDAQNDETPRISDPVQSLEVSSTTETERLISVQEVPLYEHITIAEDEEIKILDISGSRVLFAVNGKGISNTRTLAVYDMQSTEITSRIAVENRLVFYGKLIGDDFIYTGLNSDGQERPVDADQWLSYESSFISRVGTHSWDLTLSNTNPNSQIVPMPFVFQSGDVVVIDCGAVYYKTVNDEPIPRTLIEHMQVISITPDGTQKTIFSSDVLSPSESQLLMADSRLMPYRDGYTFVVEIDQKFRFYAGDENGVKEIMTVSGCRAIYPWWIVEKDRFLLTMGYGDNEKGITSIETALTTKEYAILDKSEVGYFRLTSDQDGHIAAVDQSWRSYILQISDETISAVKVSLSANPTEFYFNGDGELYAFQDNIGLFKILTHG
jgi:hypothetical protein